MKNEEMFNLSAFLLFCAGSTLHAHFIQIISFLLPYRLKHRRAKALIDFERHEDDELGFRKNDLITVNLQYIYVLQYAVFVVGTT